MPELVPPPPLECHPWYVDKPWVAQWVAGRAPEFSPHTLRIPVVPPLHASAILGHWDDTPSLKVITMRRQRAWAPAPYVGEPFVYTWWVGTDDYGRQVSSDTEIQYIE